MSKSLRQVEPADPTARRRALLAMVVVAIAGAFAYLGLEQWLNQLEVSDPDHARATLASALLWTSCAMALTVAAFGVYILMLGSRVRNAERFPPPGARVVRDTPVVTGRAARTRGLLMQLIACVMLGCALVLVAMAWRLGAYSV